MNLIASAIDTLTVLARSRKVMQAVGGAVAAFGAAFAVDAHVPFEDKYKLWVAAIVAAAALVATVINGTAKEDAAKIAAGQTPAPPSEDVPVAGVGMGVSTLVVTSPDRVKGT